MGEPEIRDSNDSLGSSLPPVQSVYGAKSHLPAVFLTTFFVVALILILTIEIRSRHQETLWNAERVLTSHVSLASANIDARFKETLDTTGAIAARISQARKVPINLDSFYSDAQASIPWVTGLALITPQIGAVAFAGMPPPGLSEDWQSEIPTSLKSLSVWQPTSETTRESPLAVVAPVGASPAVLIAWLDTQSLLQDAIKGPVPLNADQMVLVNQDADFVSGITNNDDRIFIPKELNGWASRSVESLTKAIYSYPLNGDDRVIATSALSNAPFAVSLSLPISAALAPWYRALPTYLLLMLAPAAVGVTCAIFFIRDARRKDALTRSLLNSKHRYETAVTAAKCGVWDWDLEERQVFWSTAMFKLLGYDDPARIRSFEEVSALVHPSDKTTFDGLITDMEAASSDYDLTLRMKTHGGAYAWVRLKGHSIRQENLWAKRFLGVAIDVTNEHQAREKLVETEERLRETVESLAESFHLLDASGQTLLSNKCYRELSTLLSPSDRDILGDGSGPTSISDREIRLQDGRWFQISHQKTHTGGTVQVGTDITRLKKQERMLKDSQAVLLASVDHIKKSRSQLKQQTRELADLADRYAIEKKRAQESNRSKSEFLANMSHELRTPLNAIIGFSEMMMSEIYGTLGDEKYRVYAADIFESGQHLLAMIEDILEMSRIDSGKLELMRSHIKLEDVVREVLQVVEIRARESSIRITTELGRLPSVYADPQAIRQVLLQLLSNAIKFTPENGTIHLDGEFTERSVAVTINDTGIGIPQDRVQALGQPFEIVEKQDVKSHEGKGLGLALARSLIELHGGTLTIDSREGAGTTVKFEIPVEQNLKPRDVEQSEDILREEQLVEQARKVIGGR